MTERNGAKLVFFWKDTEAEKKPVKAWERRGPGHSATKLNVCGKIPLKKGGNRSNASSSSYPDHIRGPAGRFPLLPSAMR